MIDAKNLLDRFLGPGAASAALERVSGLTGGAVAPQQGSGSSPWLNPTGVGGAGGMVDAARQALGGGTGGGGMLDAARQALGGMGGPGALAATGAAGGLLGMLVGGGKKRGRLGGVVSHGGAALLGALASRAFDNWQKGQAPAQAPVAAPAEAATLEQRFLPGATPAADGQPFELALIRAMIAAAKADGHVDVEEQRRIFGRVEELGLDAEAKAFVFDTLAAPIGPAEVAAAARTQEQAAELYLASRLAVDPDQPTERAYLEALAHRLKLPEGLAAHLDRQADAAHIG
ncbi:tellurite resistance TerB family protein [Roseomonas sp. BN140053]|uniref:tellurite resistance TerB family protein n=1 Tax=Roseomonas sp. BN140053 TaxID=3391898 RepID=UPI0039EC2515